MSSSMPQRNRFLVYTRLRIFNKNHRFQSATPFTQNPKSFNSRYSYPSATVSQSSGTITHKSRWLTLGDYHPNFLSTLAGTPPIRLLAGMERITTAPAATTLPSPMVTPGPINALAAIHTPLSILMFSLNNLPHL